MGTLCARAVPALGRVDLDANILREFGEETDSRFLDGPEAAVLDDGTQLAYMRLIELPWSAAEIIRGVASYLATETEPEISRIFVVKGREDIIESVMPKFTVAYIEHAFRP